MSIPEEQRIRRALKNAVDGIDADPDLDDLEQRGVRSDRRRARVLAGATFASLLVVGGMLVAAGALGDGSDPTESLRVAEHPSRTTIVASTTTVTPTTAVPSTSPPTSSTSTTPTTPVPTTPVPTNAPPVASTPVTSATPRSTTPVTTPPPTRAPTTPTPTTPAPTSAPSTTPPPPATSPPTTVPPSPPPATTCPTPQGLSGDQVTVRDQINASRADHGPALLADCTLAASKAQSWANQLAQEGALRHSDIRNGYPSGSWCRLAENVGTGFDLESIHDAFMNSPSHRNNILGAQFDHVGTGVAQDTSTGQYFVVHEFVDWC